MNLAIKSVFLVVSISVLSVWSVPHPGYPIANFNDSRFSNFSAFWKIPEECKSASGNPYIAGLCNSYFNILVQIHERKLTYLEYKNDSKMEEVDKFCEHFVAVLPATTSVEPVHDNIKQFKEKFGGVPFCERTCQPVDWETALTYTIELCKLVHFGYSELAKTQVAIQPFAALQKEAQGNVSVQVTQPQPVVESGTIQNNNRRYF